METIAAHSKERPKINSFYPHSKRVQYIEILQQLTYPYEDILKDLFQIGVPII